MSYLSFVGDVKLGGHAPVQEGPMDLRPNRLGQIFVDAIVLGTPRRSASLATLCRLDSLM